jgi:hypothetical protein
MATTRLNHPTKESAPAYSFAGKEGKKFERDWYVPGPDNYNVEEVDFHVTSNKGTIG